MASMKEIIISFALLGLFIVALLGFAINVSNGNNPNSSLMQDETIQSLNQSAFASLNDFTSKSDVNMNASNQEQISGGAFGLISTSIIGSVRTFGNIITGVYNIVNIFLIRNLHINPIILNVVLAILLVAIIFGAWRVYRQGN